MKTYQDALSLLPPWERFKMRCLGWWLEAEVRLPKRIWMRRVKRECGR